MIDLEPIKNLYVAGQSELAIAEGKLAANDSKLRQIDEDDARDKAELDRLLDLVREDSVRSVLSGEDTAPQKPKRRTRIFNLQENIDARAQARPVQVEICNEARRSVSNTKSKLSDAVLPALAELRLAALAECQQPLNELYQGLATVAAIDKLQDHLVGKQFAVGQEIDRRGLFSGAIVFRKLQEGLAPILRELLSPEVVDIDQHVESIAADLLDQLRSDPTVA